MVLMRICIASELCLCVRVSVMHTGDGFAVDGQARDLALSQIEDDSLQLSTLRVDCDLSPPGDLSRFEVNIEVNDLVSNGKGG